MTDNDYKRAMETALQELSDLMEEREKLDDRREMINRRINVLRDGISGLSTMSGENPYTKRPELFPNLIPPDTGLTPAVREVMNSAGTFVSTVDIKELLQMRGFNIDKYKNPLSAIHQILSRLIASGEVEVHEDEEKKLYRWKKQTGTAWPKQDAGGMGIGSVRRGLGSLRQAAEEAKIIPTREEAAIKAEERDIQALRRRRAPSLDLPTYTPPAEEKNKK